MCLHLTKLNIMNILKQIHKYNNSQPNEEIIKSLDYIYYKKW